MNNDKVTVYLSKIIIDLRKLDQRLKIYTFF